MQYKCSQCSGLYPKDKSSCIYCGYSSEANSLVQGKPQKEKRSLDYSIFIKVFVVLFVIGFPAWLIYKAGDMIHQDMTTSNIVTPVNSYDTAQKFFQAIYDKDFQSCYGLLNKDRKMAALISDQAKEVYYLQFMRIRIYLEQQVSHNFIETMDVSEDGKHVIFDNKIKLTCIYSAKRDKNKVLHYSLKEIKEFPVDTFIGLGVEAYQRQLEKVMDDTDNITNEPQDLSPEEYLAYYNNPTLRELTKSFYHQRQLDTRHFILIKIIKDHGEASYTKTFFQKVAQDNNEVFNLRNFAKDYLVGFQARKTNEENFCKM